MMHALLILVVLSSGTDQSVISLDEVTVQRIVTSLHPGSRVDVSAIIGEGVRAQGTVAVTGTEAVTFSLSVVRQIRVETPKWVVYSFVRQDPGIAQKDLERYLEGGVPLKRSAITDTVLVAAIDAPERLLTYAPDADAPWIKIHRVTAGDLIGDGSLQIRVDSEALYPVDAPRELIAPTLARILRVPDFTEIFSGVSAKMVIGPTLERTVEIMPREYRIVPPQTGTVNDITQLTGRSDKEEARFVYDGATYRHSVARPQDRTSEEIAKRQERAKLLSMDKILSIRVVNAEGQPIAGARISGSWHSGNAWINPESSKTGSISGTTDADGRYSKSTPSQITLDIHATGYYPVHRTWMQGQVPSEFETIVMEHAPQAVPTFEWSGGASWWKKWRDVFEFGATITSSPVGGFDVIAERDESDVWFVFSTEEPYGQPGAAPPDSPDMPRGKRRWTVTVYGQNGWELAPGPANPTGEQSDPNMRVAPASGYASELRFDSTKSLAFFLHHVESDRYGKVYQLDFHDGSHPGIGDYSFNLWGLVQEESSGTTSLNPMTYEERRDRDVAAPGKSPIPTAVSARVPVPSNAMVSPDRPDSADLVAAGSPSAAPIQPVAKMPPEPQSAPSLPNMDTSSAARETSDVSPLGSTKYVIIAGTFAVLLMAALLYSIKRR